MKILLKFLATGFYSGFFPYFPGTVGSFLALILSWFLKLNLWQILLFIIIGVYICTQGELLFAQHDCAKIVYDEFCGMFLASWQLSSIPQFLVAFLLFRMLDIFKPFPINKLQLLPGGWGVMADDLLAGAVARIILALLIYLGIV